MPKVLLWDTQAKKPASIDIADARQAIASGRYQDYAESNTQLTEGADAYQVDLTASGGEAIDKALLGSQLESNPSAAADVLQEKQIEEAFSTPDQYAKAFKEGILSGATLGIYEGEQGYEGEARREQRGGTYGLGELVGAIATMGTTAAPMGALTKGSEIAGARVAARLGGGSLAKVAGAAVEGGVFGITDDAIHQLADVTLRDKKFAAERLVSAGITGSLIGAGAIGALEGAKAIKAREANNLLDSVSKEVGSAKLTQENVKNAIFTPEHQKQVADAVDQARDAYKRAVNDHLSNIRILQGFKDDLANNPLLANSNEGRFLAGLGDDWFTSKLGLVDEALAAGDKVAKWKSSNLVNTDSEGFRAFVRDMEDYRSKVAALDDLLHNPINPRVPSNPKSYTPSSSIGAEGGTVVGGRRAKAAPRDRNAGTAVIREESTVAKEAAAAKEAEQIPTSEAPSWAKGHSGPDEPFGLNWHVDRWKETSMSFPPEASTNWRGLFDSDVRPDYLQSSASEKASTALKGLAEDLATLGGFPGGVPAVSVKYGLEDLRGKSEFIDSLTDAWTVAKFSKDAAKEAVRGPRGFNPQRQKGSNFSRNRAGELARYATRRNIKGYGGFIAGQAAFAFISGKFGRLAGWIDEAKLASAAAVESLLGGGRAMSSTKLFSAVHTSYTGDDKDATSDPRKKGEQLATMISNEEALRSRIRGNLGEISSISPDLASELEELQVRQLRNLSIRAPMFLALPGAVPKRPGPADNDFNQYEAVTHDPSILIDALKTASVTKPMADAFREQHPSQHAELVKQIMGGLDEDKMRKLPLAIKKQVELIIGAPLFPSLGASQQLYHAKKRQQGKMLPDGGPPNPRGAPKPSQGNSLMQPTTSPR